MTTTATIPPRIYIRGAANKNIESDFGHTASLFYIVIGAVNDLASHAMTDAMEAVRKSGHYRHSVKYHIREAQRKFDGYERMMKEQLTDRFPLFMDITDEVYEMIRPDMEKLYFSFKSELDKHREPESELKARMETAIAMLDLAVYMFDRFFDSARERTKADFRPMFLPGRLGGVAKSWHEAFAPLDKSKDTIDFNESGTCRMALRVIEVKLTGEELFNRAGAMAIRLNPDCEKYLSEEDKKILKEFEQ